jgi:uncharacterized protein (TIGR02466 family)
MRQDWFPTPIWHFQHENYQALNQRLLDRITKEKETDPQGISVSNVMGWHSQDNFHQKEEYKEFTDIISDLILNIAQEIKLDLDRVRAIVNNCWATINQKNAFNTLHHHPNSILSGVYYVKVPENSGNLYFYDPRSGGQMLLPPFHQMTPWTIGKIIYKPIEGMFIIFPSWLWHGVEPNLSEESRISLSFNIGTSVARKIDT